jgi:hypothetical protein
MKRTNTPKTGKTGPQRVFTFKQLEHVRLLSMLAATDKQIAQFFGVDVSSVEKWMQNYPTFYDARKQGGMFADMQVAQSLFKRAIGYEFQEQEFTSIRDKKTGEDTPYQHVRTVVKHIQPDVKAAIHWLRVRQRENWSVVDEQRVNHTGKIEHTHRALKEIAVDELPKEAQEMVFELTQKQLIPVYTDQN